MLTFLKTHNVSLSRIAEVTGLTRQGINQSIKNETLTLKNFALIADSLGFSMDELITELEKVNEKEYRLEVLKEEPRKVLEDPAEYIKYLEKEVNRLKSSK